MTSDDSVNVFVAFVRGVVMVLPHWATRMVKILGARPAEEVYVDEPERIIRRSHKAHSGLSASGSSFQTGMFNRGRWTERKDRNRSQKSWKRHRAAQRRQCKEHAKQA